MARADVLSILYQKKVSALDFNYNALQARPLYTMLTPKDVYDLHEIACSTRLSTKIKQKYSLINEILVSRGFKKIASGTNRVAYKYLEDQSIIIKVAIDKIGIKDSPSEFNNQWLLAPFVTKVFEVSPCGTVGVFERVAPITSREEFMSIGGDIFDIINTKIIGKYVLDDIGTQFFMNWGLREGFGPVLLDFPYVYELDGKKLYCNAIDPFGQICGGTIDYDNGFNNLICEKCGKMYFAHQLEKNKDGRNIIIRGEGETEMAITIRRGNKVIERINEGKSADVLPVHENKISIMRGNEVISEDVEITKEEIEDINKVIDRITEETPPEINNAMRFAANACEAIFAPEPVPNEEVLKTNDNISTEDYSGEVDKDVFSNNQTDAEDEILYADELHVVGHTDYDGDSEESSQDEMAEKGVEGSF